MSNNSMQYLAYADKERENLTVDRLLYLGPASHPGWFESLGIDPRRHWCVARPKFKGIHPGTPEVEVDVILGNLDSKSWPPCLDFLVAVEAKAWKKEWRDMEPWAQGPDAKTNLWDQVNRNFECGFDRVAGIDIVCTEPGQNYWDAFCAADEFGWSETVLLSRKAEESPVFTAAGHAVFAFGAVPGKDESHAGTIHLLKFRRAPPLRTHSGAVEDAVRTILKHCPQTRCVPYHYACRGSRWVAEPCH